MQTVYVVAKNMVEFGDVKQDLLERFGVSTALVFVSSLRKITGICSPKIFITSRAKFRRDYKEILQYLDGILVKDVIYGSVKKSKI